MPCLHPPPRIPLLPGSRAPHTTRLAENGASAPPWTDDPALHITCIALTRYYAVCWGRWAVGGGMARMPRSLRALPSICRPRLRPGVMLATARPRTSITMSSRYMTKGDTTKGETVGVAYPRLPRAVRALDEEVNAKRRAKAAHLSAGGQAARTAHAVQRRHSKNGSKNHVSKLAGPHAPAAVKLNTLPVVNPSTRHNPMNPPAASRSPSPTHSPAAIMQLDPSHPFDSPKSSCTTPR